MGVNKFRAKRCDSKQWVYGSLFEDVKPKYSFIYIIKNGFVPALSMPSDNFIEVMPETVGQFTGIMDTKRTEEFPRGQPIYSGDIVNMHNTECEEEDQIIQVLDKGIIHGNFEDFNIWLIDWAVDAGYTFEVIENINNK